MRGGRSLPAGFDNWVPVPSIEYPQLPMSGHRMQLPTTTSRLLAPKRGPRWLIAKVVHGQDHRPARYDRPRAQLCSITAETPSRSTARVAN